GPVARHVEDLAAERAAQVDGEVEAAVVAVQEQTPCQVGGSAPGGVAVVEGDAAVAVPIYVANVAGLRVGLRARLDLGRTLEDAVGLEYPERADGLAHGGAGHVDPSGHDPLAAVP